MKKKRSKFWKVLVLIIIGILGGVGGEIKKFDKNVQDK